MPGARGHVNHPDKIFGHLNIKPGALRGRSTGGRSTMARMNGGLAARGRRRPFTGRQEEIARVGRAARAQGGGPQNAIRRLPGGNLPKGASIDPGISPSFGGRGRGQGRNGGGPGVGQGQAAKLDIGNQLQRRVRSGAITAEQAQRTARERQTLKAKFGADWRNKLPGGPGAFREARQKLADNPNNAKLIALNKKLQGRRQQLLEAARGNKGAGGGNGGTTAPGGGGRGRVNPRGRGMMNPPGEGPAPRRRRRPAGY